MRPTNSLGGTDVARIVGASPFGGPIDVFMEKVSGLQKEQTMPMRMGLMLEPVVRQLYVEETGATIRQPHPGVVVSKKHPFLHASLDDIATRDGAEIVCEWKTAGTFSAKDFGEGADEVPTAYLVQVQHYLEVCDMPAADLGVLLLGTQGFRVYRIIRDHEMGGMLVDLAGKFWRDHVLTRRPPEPDGSEGFSNYLKHRWPESRGDMKEATPGAEATALLLKAAREEFDEVEARVKELKNALVDFIGDADGVRGAFGRITYKNVKSSTKTDWEALARELNPPVELVQKYTAIKPGGRRFVPTFAGAKES